MFIALRFIKPFSFDRSERLAPVEGKSFKRTSWL